MRLPLIAFALVIALMVAALGAGCLQESPSGTSSPEARYAPGDLLRGDLVGAGFDDPNGTPAGAAIVIIESRPTSEEYVFSLVQPVSGGWAYVYPSGDFVLRLSRDRTMFESYRLDRIGRIDLPAIEGPPNATASQRP